MTEPLAVERWRELLARWALPSAITERAPEPPWRHDVEASVDDTGDRATCDRNTRDRNTRNRNTPSARWAREVLPPRGGTVLDVGCGGGGSSVPLVPPATELIGVDRRGAMLDEFVRAAADVGVARRTVHGDWPDVAPITPIADVVICHQVLYGVGDLVPFVLALTEHARLAVVVELSVRHPMSAWSEAWQHFWDLRRPDGPTHLDVVAVLSEIGIDAEVTVGPRQALSRAASDPANLVATARRRLCLPAERDDELAAWLGTHPPSWVTEAATIRWAGEARPEAV